MKKIISVLLSIVLVVSLAGCGGGDTAAYEYEEKMTEITEQLSKGKIPEVDYALGDNPDGIQKHFEDMLKEAEPAEGEEGHDHSHEGVTSFTVQQGIQSVKMDAGKFVYHYELAKKDAGVSVIVSFTEAYGFTVGEATMQDVSAAFDPNSIEKLTATEDDMYFLVYPIEGCMILRYEEDNKKLDFFFSENVLIAALVMDTNNWTL